MLQPLRDSTTAFGSGAGEPYANALRDPARSLFLHRLAPRSLNPDTGDSRPLDVQSYLAPADIIDEDLVLRFRGTVLDIGCGPGRIVQAAILAGHLALGIDISTTAVAIAQERGLPVLCRSVFQELPAEGTWGTVIVLDGNIGIGGDPLALLERCVDLVTQDGQVLVEVHPETARYRLYDGIVVDDLAQRSLPFPWAEVGAEALHGYATSVGLTQRATWGRGHRAFVLYGH